MLSAFPSHLIIEYPNSPIPNFGFETFYDADLNGVCGMRVHSPTIKLRMRSGEGRSPTHRECRQTRKIIHNHDWLICELLKLPAK
jgi:hypothetical protein